MKLVTGLHHITALASDPQRNVDFYAGILGLRMVKKTVNYDAPEIYHLYYRNESGTPGTIMTFFPYVGIPRGRKGKGQLTVTSFSVGENSVEYWLRRLAKFNVKHNAIARRFDDELFIYLEDNDGLGLELVFTKGDERSGFGLGNVPGEFAIKGFYGITLSEECYEKTAGLLTVLMDHELIRQEGSRFRFSASGKTYGFVDVLCTPDALQGISGSGTIHHVAFATADQSTQLEARAKLVKSGFNITPVINREYFHSVYYREPGGVLFEIATLPPGFTVDEKLAHLGESFKLPPWLEKNRQLIEEILPPIQLDLQRFE